MNFSSKFCNVHLEMRKDSVQLVIMAFLFLSLPHGMMLAATKMFKLHNTDIIRNSASQQPSSLKYSKNLNFLCLFIFLLRQTQSAK